MSNMQSVLSSMFFAIYGAACFQRVHLLINYFVQHHNLLSVSDPLMPTNAEQNMPIADDRIPNDLQSHFGFSYVTVSYFCWYADLFKAFNRFGERLTRGVSEYLLAIFCRECVRMHVRSIDDVLCNGWGCMFSAHPFMFDDRQNIFVSPLITIIKYQIRITKMSCFCHIFINGRMSGGCIHRNCTAYCVCQCWYDMALMSYSSLDISPPTHRVALKLKARNTSTCFTFILRRVCVQDVVYSLYQHFAI